jgi:uncharacterized protein YndB with AHSA1/START domain
MLMADLPEVEVSVYVAASPESVWEKVTDIDLPGRFSAEFQGAQWLENATPALGARFRGRNQRGEFAWSTTCTVVDFSPPHSFAWVVEDPEVPIATWSYELEPHGAGVDLWMRARLGPGRSGLNIAVEANPDKEERIVARRLEEWRSNMAATLEGIKALAEG